MGPSLLIGTCLILAIRTAKWPATFNERCSEMDLDRGLLTRLSWPAESWRLWSAVTRASFLVEWSPGTGRRMKIAQSDKVATLALLILAMQERSTRLTGDELTGAHERVEILSTGNTILTDLNSDKSNAERYSESNVLPVRE
jgi:hypothetical protein